MKVCWERDAIKEETWEPELQMRADYPELFSDERQSEEVELNSGMNSFVEGENCNTP